MDPFKDLYVNQLQEKLKRVATQCLFISKKIDKHGKVAYDHSSEQYQAKAAERDAIARQLRDAFHKAKKKESGNG